VTCPFCTKAKELLTSLGAKYKVVEVDALGEDGFAYRVELNDMTGHSTVPNIFVVRVHACAWGCGCLMFGGPGLVGLEID
jgi:glutaredoxin